MGRTVEKRPGLALAPALILLLILAAGVWGLLFSSHYFLRYGDGLDYAQIAETVSSTGAMTTRTYPLFGLNYLKEQGLLDHAWPNLHRFPFPVLVTAGLYRVLGVGNFSTALSSGIFYMLTIPLFYLLAARVLRSRLSALLISFVLMLNPYILPFSISNTTEMPAIFLFTLLVYVLCRGSFEGNYFLGGAILGVLYYNRYNALLFVPALIGFVVLFTRQHRVRNSLHLVLAFAAVALPWFAYTWVHTGNPLFSLTAKADFPVFTPPYPYLHSLWYGLDFVNEWEFLLAHPLQMARKWLSQFLWTRAHFPRLVGDSLILFAFFLVGLFVRERDPQKRRLKQLTVLLFLSQLLVIPFYVNVTRFYAPFTPVFMLLGFDYLLRVLADLRLDRRLHRAALIATTVLLCLPGIKVLAIGVPYEGHDYSFGSETQTQLASLSSAISPEDIVSSDIVVAAGRYLPGRSLPLPQDLETLERTQEEFLPIRAVLLTDYVLTKEIWQEWWPVYQERGDIPGFTLLRALPDGTLLYLNERTEEELNE